MSQQLTFWSRESGSLNEVLIQRHYGCTGERPRLVLNLRPAKPAVQQRIKSIARGEEVIAITEFFCCEPLARFHHNVGYYARGMRTPAPAPIVNCLRLRGHAHLRPEVRQAVCDAAAQH